MRKCRICNIEKPLNRYSWRSDSQAYRTECKDCLNISRKTQPRYKKWHTENKDKVKSYMRNYDLKRHYGLTIEEFDKLFLSQNGKCAICKTDAFVGKGKKPHVDHCHITGKIRGLLCSQCNVGLGSFKDNPEFLISAIAYINKHDGTK